MVLYSSGCGDRGGVGNSGDIDIERERLRQWPAHWQILVHNVGGRRGGGAGVVVRGDNHFDRQSEHDHHNIETEQDFHGHDSAGHRQRIARLTHDHRAGQERAGHHGHQWQLCGPAVRVAGGLRPRHAQDHSVVEHCFIWFVQSSEAEVQHAGHLGRRRHTNYFSAHFHHGVLQKVSLRHAFGLYTLHHLWHLLYRRLGCIDLLSHCWHRLISFLLIIHTLIISSIMIAIHYLINK